MQKNTAVILFHYVPPCTDLSGTRKSLIQSGDFPLHRSVLVEDIRSPQNPERRPLDVQTVINESFNRSNHPSTPARHETNARRTATPTSLRLSIAARFRHRHPTRRPPARMSFLDLATATALSTGTLATAPRIEIEGGWMPVSPRPSFRQGTPYPSKAGRSSTWQRFRHSLGDLLDPLCLFHDQGALSHESRPDNGEDRRRQRDSAVEMPSTSRSEEERRLCKRVHESQSERVPAPAKATGIAQVSARTIHLME